MAAPAPIPALHVAFQARAGVPKLEHKAPDGSPLAKSLPLLLCPVMKHSAENSLNPRNRLLSQQIWPELQLHSGRLYSFGKSRHNLRGKLQASSEPE